MTNLKFSISPFVVVNLLLILTSGVNSQGDGLTTTTTTTTTTTPSSINRETTIRITNNVYCYQCRSDEEPSCQNNPDQDIKCTDEAIENFIQNLNHSKPKDSSANWEFSLNGRQQILPSGSNFGERTARRYQCGKMVATSEVFTMRFCMLNIEKKGCNSCKFKMPNDAQCCYCQSNYCNGSKLLYAKSLLILTLVVLQSMHVAE